MKIKELVDSLEAIYRFVNFVKNDEIKISIVNNLDTILNQDINDLIEKYSLKDFIVKFDPKDPVLKYFLFGYILFEETLKEPSEQSRRKFSWNEVKNIILGKIKAADDSGKAVTSENVWDLFTMIIPEELENRIEITEQEFWALCMKFGFFVNLLGKTLNEKQTKTSGGRDGNIRRDKKIRR